MNALVYLEIQRQFVGSEDTQLYLRHANFQVFKVVSLLSSSLFHNLFMKVFIILFNFCNQTKHTNQNRLYVNKDKCILCKELIVFCTNIKYVRLLMYPAKWLMPCDMELTLEAQEFFFRSACISKSCMYSYLDKNVIQVHSLCYLSFSSRFSFIFASTQEETQTLTMQWFPTV